MTDTERAAYRAGAQAMRRAAVELATVWATENLRLASDSILTDPLLARGDISPAAARITEQCQLDGAIHSSMAHAAQDVSAAIAALPLPEMPDAEGTP